MSKKKQQILIRLVNDDMAYIHRLEKKIDFLMKKQVERDMKEAMGGE